MFLFIQYQRNELVPLYLCSCIFSLPSVHRREHQAAVAIHQFPLSAEQVEYL
jgi:hypothetical protein